MVRRKKDQPPMKTYPVRMSEELHEEMQCCAEIADESDSEYIRKAVEMRNKYELETREQYPSNFAAKKAYDTAHKKDDTQQGVQTFFKGNVEVKK